MGHRKTGIAIRLSTTCKMIFILHCMYFTLGVEDIFCLKQIQKQTFFLKSVNFSQNHWVAHCLQNDILGILFFFFLKYSITKFATIHSVFFHTHTSANISFLKCETGLPGGIFTFYVAIDEATSDTGYVTVKS